MMTIRKALSAVVIMTFGVAVADGPFYLSGSNTVAAVEISSSTNATVTLDGWYSEKTLRFVTDAPEGVTFTIKEKKGSENVIKVADNLPAIDAYGCDLVFDGKGKADFISKKKVSKGDHVGGIVICRNLTVEGGDTTVKFDQNKPDTACVLLTGDYLQSDGEFKVSMPKLPDAEDGTNAFAGVKFDSKHTAFTLAGGKFEANVGGRKSAGVDLKGSCVANLDGGSFLATVKGPQARAIGGGTINFAGSKVRCELHEDVTDPSAVAGAKLFKAEKALNVIGGDIELELISPESELLCSDDSITVSGGRVTLVSGDDCVNAQTNVFITGGELYARSVSGDGVDANGNIIIEGGLVLAYALSGEEKGLDVNNAGVSGAEAGVLTITGGTVVSLGGPQSHFQGEDSLLQPCFTASQTSGAPYSTKYLSLPGVDGLGRPMTTTVRLPEIPGRFSILATAPGYEVPTAPTLGETAPARGDIGFHEVWRECVVGSVLSVF